MFQYGVLGIFVLVFAAVIYWLYTDSQRERKTWLEKLEQLHKDHLNKMDEQRASYVESLEKLSSNFVDRIERLQQKRVEDLAVYQEKFVAVARSAEAALVGATSALESNKDTMKDVRASIREMIRE